MDRRDGVTRLWSMVYTRGNLYLCPQAAYTGRRSVQSFFAAKQAIADLITSVLFFIFVGLVFWKGGEMALDSLLRLEHTPTVWSPIIYPTKLTIPVAAFMLIVQEGVTNCIRNAYFLIKGRAIE